MIPITKPYLTDEEARSAYDTVMSGWVAQGPRVEEFEMKFCEYTGSEFATAVSNCTTALHLSLIVAGIGSGDEVICPSLSYIASSNSIKYVNAIPVFADIDQDTCNMNPAGAEALITEKTKAILLVHQIGMPADINAFGKICKKHNLKLIEDAACALGSEYHGKKIGSDSELACFSFHPRKVITTGEGGMITTNSKEYNDRLKILRQHGMRVSARDRHNSSKVMSESHDEIGYNYRMTDIQASIGIRQLEKLDWIVNERRKIASKYIEGLKHVECISLPLEREGCFTNYQSFSIYLKKSSPVSRDELMKKLFDAGISTRKGVMTSHRELPYIKEYEGISLPVSEDVCDNSILIPLYVPMTDDEINHIIRSLKNLLAA